MVSRIAGAQLHAIGVPELITRSAAEYEALALSLARDPQRLESYRARLRANRQSSPLFDMVRYARDFETLMLETWESRGQAAFAAA
jgi:predicted O-linked N-acetylglucosamine transferase (SPINDLY family)